MSENLLQVAIYARVSSDHQAKAATIDSQVAALKKRVQENGHVAEEELCFLDDGYSGGTLVRPGLERLRDVAYAGAIDRVYVHSPDRLARKYAYQVLLVDELTKAGVEVVFLNHTISDSPEDELLLQMQGMIAEYERAKILERSRRGKRHAARRGSVNVLSGAPYGYRYISKQEGEGQARYEILEEEASVVQQVFQWIGRDGISIGEVRRRLHDQGVKTKTGKDWWDRATIWAMLKNPAYKGSAAFGKTRVGKRLPQLRPQRGQAEQPRKSHSTYDTLPEEQELIPVPALVEEALFDAVAEQLVENKRRNRQGGRGAKYLLQGLLQCACCNYSYYGKQLSRSGRHGKKVDYAYYRCIGTDAYRFAGERVCDNKQVRTDLLEESVWDDICQLLRDPDRVRLEYERRLEGGSQQAFARRKQLETTIHKVQRAIARLIDIYEEGLLTKEEFEPRIRASKSRLSKLQEEEMTLFAEQSEQAQLHVVIDHLEAFQEQLAGGLDELDWHARREVIRLLVKRVEIDRNEVRIIYKVSPPPFASSPASGACLQDCCRGNSADGQCFPMCLSDLLSRGSSTRPTASQPAARGAFPANRPRRPWPIGRRAIRPANRSALPDAAAPPRLRVDADACRRDAHWPPDCEPPDTVRAQSAAAHFAVPPARSTPPAPRPQGIRTTRQQKAPTPRRAGRSTRPATPGRVCPGWVCSGWVCPTWACCSNCCFRSRSLLRNHRSVGFLPELLQKSRRPGYNLKFAHILAYKFYKMFFRIRYKSRFKPLQTFDLCSVSGDCKLDEAASPREGGAVYRGCVGLGRSILIRVIRLDFRLMWPEFLTLPKGYHDVRTQKPYDPGHEACRVGRRDRQGVSSGCSPVGCLLHGGAGPAQRTAGAGLYPLRPR